MQTHVCWCHTQRRLRNAHKETWVGRKRATLHPELRRKSTWVTDLTRAHMLHANRCATGHRASPGPGPASQPLLCLSFSDPLSLWPAPTHTNPLQGLRLHDNPALVEACTGSTHVYPIFIIDPFFLKSGYK